MDTNTNQIEREIVAERHQLGRNLNELEIKAHELADWRTHYRRHPKVLLGLAIGGGLLAGALAGHGRSSRRDSATARALRPQGRASRHIENTVSGVSDALLGAASAKVMAFVGNLVAGMNKPSNRSQPSSRYVAPR